MGEERRIVRCAIYTRKSSDEGLDQEFNSLDAQFEACSSYIASQRHEGWKALSARYDDGGYSGGTLERPALRRLLGDIEAGRVDMVVVYKIDRLTRSLLDFGKLVEQMDKATCSFVSVTQSFNTSTSMGRLTLNMLLSFAQFEREVTAERIRDKIAASKKKGIWMGGVPPLGYFAKERQLIIHETEAAIVRRIFDLYREHRCIIRTKQAAERLAIRSRATPKFPDGALLTRGGIYWLLTNPIYVGEIRHKATTYPGLHSPIIERDTWNEVQTLLTSQPSGRRRGRQNASFPSPLAGRLVDEAGDRLVPSHSGSATDRRRYYISQRLIEGGANDLTSGGWRLSANHLEQVVASVLRGHFGQRAAGALAIASGADSDKLAKADRALQGLINGEAADSAYSLIEQVQIFQGSMQINIARSKLAEAIGVDASNCSLSFLKIAAPFQKRRRGVETRLLLGDTPAMLDKALLKYVARAFVWWQAILDGQAIGQVAKAFGVSDRLIAIHLPAAFLAPDILELIVDGRQPPGLTVSFLRSTKIPASWHAQRELFGIAENGRNPTRKFAAG